MLVVDYKPQALFSQGAGCFVMLACNSVSNPERAFVYERRFHAIICRDLARAKIDCHFITIHCFPIYKDKRVNNVSLRHNAGK